MAPTTASVVEEGRPFCLVDVDQEHHHAIHVGEEVARDQLEDLRANPSVLQDLFCQVHDVLPDHRVTDPVGMDQGVQGDAPLGHGASFLHRCRRERRRHVAAGLERIQQHTEVPDAASSGDSQEVRVVGSEERRRFCAHPDELLFDHDIDSFPEVLDEERDLVIDRRLGHGGSFMT